MSALSAKLTSSTAKPRRHCCQCEYKNVCHNNSNKSLISICAPQMKCANHKFLLIVFLCTMGLLLTVSGLPTVNAATNPRISPKPVRTEPGACRSIDVRNDCASYEQLHNCTVIRGFLLIVLVPAENYETKQPCHHENYTFPLLREITDFLIFHDVRGLRSIRNLFPNLAVIRGRRLFLNYALGITNMPDMEAVSIDIVFSNSTCSFYN